MAAGMRGGLGLASWIFLTGGLIMMWFVVLSATVNVAPLNNIYFLEANTTGITGARTTSRWTYLFICGGDNLNCGGGTPALPFGWAWSHMAANVPSDLIGSYGDDTTSFYYYYVWRFGWVFYLLGLIFGVLAFFFGLLSCTRLGSAISSLTAFIASFWMTLAAILMTVEFVKARDAFHAYGRDAHIGTYAFAFTWAATICLFIAGVLFLGGCCIGRERGDGVVTKRARIFGRSRSTRSRGSFLDTESRRVVKEEY